MEKSPIQLDSRGATGPVLALELLKSQRRKCRFAAAIYALGGCVAGTFMVLNADFFEAMGDSEGVRFWFLTVPATMVMFQFICIRLLNDSIRTKGRSPSFVALLTSVIEPTALTIWLGLACTIFHPAVVLKAPIANFYIVIVLLAAMQLSWRLCIATSLIAAGQYAALTVIHWPELARVFSAEREAFMPDYWVRAAIILFGGVVGAFVAREIRSGVERTLDTVKERDFVVNIFGRYLTDEVVDDILRSPEGLMLGGRRRTVTLMMTDLRGFSTLSESLAPEAVIAMLNRFLETMTDVIFRHRGTIDEFIGDAILVIFGAPVGAEDDARRAVACAIEMQLAMEGVNEGNAAAGLPRIEMGIGIHTGQVVVGNIGSEKRSKYGVVGSAVNLTARIESYTVGGQILVSAATAEAAGEGVRIAGRRLVQPKGSAHPVEICDVRGLAGDAGELCLPEFKDAPVRLDPPLPVRFLVFEDKDSTGLPCSGELTEISRHSARLRTGIALPPLANLRLALYPPKQNFVPGALMAKMTEAGPEDFKLRFTAMEESVREYVEGLIG